MDTPIRYATCLQYIPRNMHMVFALLCFVVVIHWLIFPYPSGLLHWHCGNLTIAPVPAKQPWWIWINTSCEFIMNDCITTTKQSTTKPCAYFLGYTVLISCVYSEVEKLMKHIVVAWPRGPIDAQHINPLHAKFFRRNKNIHLHFMSLLHIDMTRVIGILPQVRPGLTYST